MLAGREARTIYTDGTRLTGRSSALQEQNARRYQWPPQDSTCKGAPVVVPPSGKFIAQLFLVPFLIVTLVVCFLIAINWLVGGARSPKDFLDKLDSSNPEVHGKARNWPNSSYAKKRWPPIRVSLWNSVNVFNRQSRN